MADITKCNGVDCNKKTLCYRYTAPNSGWQSYFMCSPASADDSCEFFMPLKPVKENKGANV